MGLGLFFKLEAACHYCQCTSGILKTKCLCELEMVIGSHHDDLVTRSSTPRRVPARRWPLEAELVQETRQGVAVELEAENEFKLIGCTSTL